MSEYMRVVIPHDPYCYPNTNVLINKFNITNLPNLAQAEAMFSAIALRVLYDSPLEGKYDFEHLCEFHKFAFQDLYTWAGTPRVIDLMKREEILNNQSVDYTHAPDIPNLANAVLNEMRNREWGKMSLDEQATHLSSDMAKLWKVHPFREGNTRTTIAFVCQFAESKGMYIDRNIFAKNADITRATLVIACGKGEIYDIEALRSLVKLALADGLEKNKNQNQKRDMNDWKSILSKMRDDNTSNKGASNTKMKKPREER